MVSNEILCLLSQVTYNFVTVLCFFLVTQGFHRPELSRGRKGRAVASLQAQKKSREWPRGPLRRYYLAPRLRGVGETFPSWATARGRYRIGFRPAISASTFPARCAVQIGTNPAPSRRLAQKSGTTEVFDAFKLCWRSYSSYASHMAGLFDFC